MQAKQPSHINSASEQPARGRMEMGLNSSQQSKLKPSRNYQDIQQKVQSHQVARGKGSEMSKAIMGSA